MARSDELLILANRIDVVADDVGHGAIKNSADQLWEIARELREYVKQA